MTAQTPFSEFNQIHLVGIKGVALTALAHCLNDCGITITGSDVAEDFVTKDQLERIPYQFHQLSDPLPTGTEAVIYTGAHNGSQNQQVLEAESKGLPVFSHAEALAVFFNAQQGIAVCGVGGKSTTSAMLAWIYHQLDKNPSYAVGVGGIPGLKTTGKFNQESTVFIAEADEYSENPVSSKYETLIPRFSYLKPHAIICTNLAFDHPDVYRDFEQTQQVFLEFFNKLSSDGFLVIQGDDKQLLKIAQKSVEITHATLITYGTGEHNQFRLSNFTSEDGVSQATITTPNKTLKLSLPIPGEFNCMNALAALSLLDHLKFDLEKVVTVLADFHSTRRRFEKIGLKNGVTYYDDYAHHPTEIAAAVAALDAWYPDTSKIIAFQPHTFSRTKQLFDQFVEVLSHLPTVYLLDIFPSAREAADPTITIELLAEAIKEKNPTSNLKVFHSLEALAEACKQLSKDSVVLTLGAGDIYHIHEMI